MKTKLLKDLTTKIGSGATPKGGKSAYKKSGISLIRSQNVLDYYFSVDGLAFIDDKQAEKLNNVTVHQNDVLLNITGDSIARCCQVPDSLLPARVNQHVSILRTTDELDADYLKYYLINLKHYLLQICKVGGTRNALTKDAISNLPIKLNNKQSEIAQVLKFLDQKIELNNRINQELESVAKLIYDYWFVQFDFPISAEYAVNVGKPELEGQPYKASGGKMVYSEELKREVPEGWEVKKIIDWIKTDKSGDWGKESEQGNYTTKVNCIRGADLNGLNGKGQLKSPVRFILQKNQHKLLLSHDIIIEISGGSPTQSTGRMSFVIDEVLDRFENPLICSNFCKALTLNENKSLFNFKYAWERLYDNNILFGFEGKTSGIKNLLFETVASTVYLPYPDNNILEIFYKRVMNIEKKKQFNLKENQRLTDLRDWLLPMLMNGQVTVKV